MRIFITGGTGLIGRRLVADRLQRGDDVIVLSRSIDKARAILAPAECDRLEVIEGDPTVSGSWPERLAGCDAVVNLAGAGIADRRWTKAYKREIARSRIESTTQVVETIRSAARAGAPPRRHPGVLINASAMGYYGETGDRIIDESAPAGDDFLADVCARWEAAAMDAGSDAARAVCLRAGVVLDSRKGGPLAQMMLPFRFFLGGPLGSGRQWMSWIHWRDLVGIVDRALANPACAGPINAVAPGAVTNRDFCRALGRALGRPCWLPAPKFGLRLALGEFATYLTMSQRIAPAKAQALGCEFAFPELAGALDDLVGASTGE